MWRYLERGNVTATIFTRQRHINLAILEDVETVHRQCIHFTESVDEHNAIKQRVTDEFEFQKKREKAGKIMKLLRCSDDAFHDFFEFFGLSRVFLVSRHRLPPSRPNFFFLAPLSRTISCSYHSTSPVGQRTHSASQTPSPLQHLLIESVCAFCFDVL
jgi:hypothetical protein